MAAAFLACNQRTYKHARAEGCVRNFKHQLVEALHIHLPKAAVGSQHSNPKVVARHIRQVPVTLILLSVTIESLSFMKTGIKLGARKELKLFIVGGKATYIACWCLESEMARG